MRRDPRWRPMLLSVPRSPRPRFLQRRVDAIKVSLHLVGAALVDDFASERLAGKRPAVRRRCQFAFDAVHAFAEHDLDAMGMLAQHDDLHGLTAFGDAHSNLLDIHAGLHSLKSTLKYCRVCAV